MRRGAVVLCGGRSRRMGRDKATLPFGRETLLQRVVRLVLPLVEEVVVVGRPGQDLPALPDAVLVARDEVLDRGPLGGLVPGLAASGADAVFATGCDVPFLRPEVVRLLFDALGSHQVAIAEAQGRLHPLAAVYRREVREAMARRLAEGRLRPVDLCALVPTVRVGEAALRAVDPALETLANLNTEAAYAAALEARARREGP